MVGPPPTATCPGQVRGARGKGSTAPCRPTAGRTATRCRLETRAHREKRAPSKRGSQGACAQHSGRLSPAARCREPPPGANLLLNASLADIMRGTEGLRLTAKGREVTSVSPGDRLALAKPTATPAGSSMTLTMTWEAHVTAETRKKDRKVNREL